MRVQVEDLPLIESTKTSSTANKLATSGCSLFQRSSPASAAFLSGEFATTTSGILVRVVFVFGPTDFAREGATRGASPSILRKCGGHGASGSPAASSLFASSSKPSSDPAASSIPACGSPACSKRFG